MNHVLITAASSEPVTVSDVKIHSGVVGAVDDTLIASWIKSGRKLAEDFQHRAYISQVWEIVGDDFPLLPLLFPRPALLSVDSIKYYDTSDAETVFGDSNYYVDVVSEVGRLTLGYQKYWPNVILRPINGVLIRYTAGYGADADAVPDSVKDALYLYCSWRYDNRTGESGRVPKAFYDILYPDKLAVY